MKYRVEMHPDDFGEFIVGRLRIAVLGHSSMPRMQGFIYVGMQGFIYVEEWRLPEGAVLGDLIGCTALASRDVPRMTARVVVERGES